MTLNDLKNEVSALGFEPEADTGPILIAAANRALSMIYSDIPCLKTVRIPVSKIKPSQYIRELSYTGLAPISLAASGTAYSFSVSGEGKFTVCDKNSTREQKFDTPLSLFRGFISGEGRIVFSGDYPYSVFDFSVFERARGANAEDIPAGYGSYRVKITDVVGDFLAFYKKPCDEGGTEITKAHLSGEEIIFPEGFSGLASLTYMRAPRKIEEGTGEIDIAHSLAYLLPLLTAYFVWLDDDAEKSERYLSLYKSSAERALRLSLTSDCGYTDVTGWA